MNQYCVFSDGTVFLSSQLNEWDWDSDDYILVEANSEQEALELVENMIY